MKLKILSSLVLCCALIFSCGSDDNNGGAVDPNNENPTDTTTNSAVNLLSSTGRQILGVDGNPIQLNGIGFNNWHWIEDPLPPTTHHSEIDFSRVSDMGMNAVRFGMNYWIFEDDAAPYQYKQTGWDWIDDNIEWAKKNGVYLILNMHTPQGGYQSAGEGDALWNDSESQNRLVALWKAIAERYKDEPQIAGYGIVNEPIPTQSIDQWSQLAQRLIDEIRTVDDHIIFVEQAISVKGVAEPDPELNFPRVTGENIVYEFHTYEPYQFTHQLMDFSGVGDGGKYPDEELLEMGDATWQTAIFNNPVLNGNSDWLYFEGQRYVVNDPEISIGLPVMITGNIGAGGRVNFDDLIINEYDTDGNFVRSINQEKLNDEPGWEFWSRNDQGLGGVDSTIGRTDNMSFYISGATDESNLNNRFAAFEPIQGFAYEISGWMRGQNISTDGDALFRLDFYSTEGPVHRRNKAYLESVLDRVDSWAASKNVPIYIGEIGTGAPSFENDKGGLIFVEDMVTLILEKKIHFTYFDYHDSNFGIYLGFDAVPDPNNVRQPMIDLFEQLLVQ